MLPGGVLAADLRERVDAHHLGLELQPTGGEAAVVAVELVERAARVAAGEREPRAIQRAELLGEHRARAPPAPAAILRGADSGAIGVAAIARWAGVVADGAGWCRA